MFRFMPERLCVIALFIAFCPALCAGQTRDEVRAKKEAEIVKLVRENFFNPTIAEQWAVTHAHFAEAARDDASFAALARRALADLKTSHTGYYDTHDPEYYGLLSIFSRILHVPAVEMDSPGADFTSEGMVRVVFAGGPAQQAGLNRGNRILSADGKPFHRVDSFRGRAGKPVTLQVECCQNAPPITLTVTPRRIDPKKEWLEAQIAGSQIIEVKGKKIGYVPMFSGSGEEFEDALRQTLKEKLRAADAVVIDFRNGFGGCSPSFVNIFTREPPALWFVDRSGKEEVNDSQWRKPVVLLIDRGSRSGKEAVAAALKKHKLATLVGERTAGAVVGGRCFKIGEDSVMYLAVNDVRVDGERLEGVGVTPDIEVSDSLLYADGRDPQLEKALDVAAGGK